MRDNGRRREWFHATRRYRDARRVVLEVPVRRSRLGAVPLLPPNCELVGGAVYSGERAGTRSRTALARERALNFADAGVRLLVATMYGGRRERIVPPPAVAAVAFGG
jgi:hypothetical protein